LTNSFSWRCPACEQALVLIDRQWQCCNKHSFDKAKEGYVNLLLAQHKNSKAPGDNKDMVLARRAFLSQGHYLPLAIKIAELLREQLGPMSSESVALFDAGCGEGYYLQAICKELAAQHIKPIVSGIDISKPAVQKAAKLNKHGEFAVASCFNIPLAENSQNAVIQIFAPSSPSEIKRILKHEGVWIAVNPAADHLRQLKSIVYDSPQSHELDTQAEEGFSLLAQERLSFTIHLENSEERNNLLLMTPFYWTISKAKKEQLLSQLMEVKVDFDIKIMQATH